MNDAQTNHILARLEIGLRTDSTRLIELEQDLIVALRRARGLGEEFGSPGDWNTAWCHHWDHVEAILQRIRGLLQEMQEAISSLETDRLSKALTAWETLQEEDAKLVLSLGALRQQAVGLNESAQDEWKTMARALEPHLETIHGCAQALRLKLELLKVHSKEEVDHLVKELLARLPLRLKLELLKVHSKEEVDHLVKELLARLPLRLKADATASGENAQAYDKAEAELDHERHTYMGLMDVIKGLFMWVETTDERIHKNLSLG